MAEYSNLSATINAQIRANGVQAITGPVLNAVLTAMVNVLGDGYRLKGVAVPADNPGSPDNRVAYLAAQDGTYTDFGGLAVSGEVALLLWDSAWTKATLVSIDTAVTPGSDNLITSDAVNSAISALATQYMALVPAATEGNLAEFDNAGQVRDAGLATSDLATKDGHYLDLFAGFAGNLVDTRSAGTRQGPFAFRQSGGDGVNYMRKILGRTEVFNQMAAAAVRDKMQTVSTTSQTAISSGGFGVPCFASHKYLFVARITTLTAADSIWFWGGDRYVNNIGLLSSELKGWIVSPSVDKTEASFVVVANRGGGGTTGTAGYEDLWCVDLTLMFGAGNEPTTYDQFRALHPLPYYNYNAGVLKNNAATGLETVGFNIWDEAWELGIYDYATGQPTPSTVAIRCANYIPCHGGSAYYFKVPGSSTLRILWYDADKKFISSQTAGNLNNTVQTSPANAGYMRFGLSSVYGTTYNHDICINISDASRNGDYEPYWKREIVLGLNNLACHDENNNAVVVNGLDGVGTAQDELVVENGWGTKINKVMAEVDLGNLEIAADFYSTYSILSLVVPDIIANAINNAKGLLICSAFEVINTTGISAVGQASVDGVIAYRGTGNDAIDKQIVVKKTGYADAATFMAALSGVKLRFVLATPKVLTLDNPIPALIEVDNLGTEKRLPEDTADSPQAPFECDSNYSVSTANLVRLLNL